MDKAKQGKNADASVTRAINGFVFKKNHKAPFHIQCDVRPESSAAYFRAQWRKVYIHLQWSIRCQPTRLLLDLQRICAKVRSTVQ